VFPTTAQLNKEFIKYEFLIVSFILTPAMIADAPVIAFSCPFQRSLATNLDLKLKD